MPPEELNISQTALAMLRNLKKQNSQSNKEKGLSTYKEVTSSEWNGLNLHTLKQSVAAEHQLKNDNNRVPSKHPILSSGSDIINVCTKPM